jgi:hypothetical protein
MLVILFGGIVCRHFPDKKSEKVEDAQVVKPYKKIKIIKKVKIPFKELKDYTINIGKLDKKVKVKVYCIEGYKFVYTFSKYGIDVEQLMGHRYPVQCE